MARYDTAANIINDVAVEVGLAASSDVWASTDQSFVQLRYLLKSVGRGLVLENDWLQSRKEYTFTTTTATSYSLPADFLSMIPQSGWNRTTRFPLTPASSQQWQYLNAAQSVTTFTVVFKPSDTALTLWTPVSGCTIAFEYLSTYWVALDGSTTPTKDAPTLNTDIICINVQLITRALKLAFLQAKGFDTSAALSDYESALSGSRGANATDAPVLSLNGPSAEEKFVDMSNAPLSGFGFDGTGGLF